MYKQIIVSMCCMLAMAGCTPITVPVSQSSGAPKTTVQQQVPAQGVKNTHQNSGQTTPAETNTKARDASVAAIALVAAVAAASGKSSRHSSSDYAGTWNVSTEQGRICQMTLEPLRSNAPQGQVQASGCFGKLFGVNRWLPRGNQIILSDAFGKPKATLLAVGRKRLDGDGISMWR